MKILCDQCVNTDIVRALSEGGFDAIHTSRVGLARAGDPDVFQYAQKTGRVLLSFDHGFANITAFDIRNAHGVVIIYVEGMNKSDLVSRTLAVFNDFLRKHPVEHTLVIVSSKSIRVWPR